MRVEVDTLKERGHVEPLRICEKSVRRFSYSYSCGAARRNRARHVPIIFFNRLNSLAPFFRILAVAFSRLSRRKAVSRSSIVNDEARTAPPRALLRRACRPWTALGRLPRPLFWPPSACCVFRTAKGFGRPFDSNAPFCVG